MNHDADRRCQTCIDRHGRLPPGEDRPVFHGHVISKGSPATFRCNTCGRKAFWNTGERVPSLWRWLRKGLFGGEEGSA